MLWCADQRMFMTVKFLRILLIGIKLKLEILQIYLFCVFDKLQKPSHVSWGYLILWLAFEPLVISCLIRKFSGTFLVQENFSLIHKVLHLILKPGMTRNCTCSITAFISWDASPKILREWTVKNSWKLVLINTAIIDYMPDENLIRFPFT